MAGVTESAVESAALTWLESLSWAIRYGPDPAPDTLFIERQDYVGLARRLRDALLPKLIRGEIRVRDAERFLKERGLC